MQVLFILGMHRSGTSALARCLQQMGTSFTLPKIQDGYWDKHIEYYQVNQLNDKIMTSWKAPVMNRNPFFRMIMSLRTKWFVKTTIPTEGLIGIKDPRFLLTFDYWAREIDDFKIIGIFRRPEEVAKSLSIRDEYGKASFSQGLQLWKDYNVGLLQIHEKYNFPILNFNEEKVTFGKQLESICDQLSLPFSYEVFDDIFTDKQKHHHSENIPKEYLQTYDKLIQLTKQLD